MTHTFPPRIGVCPHTSHYITSHYITSHHNTTPHHTTPHNTTQHHTTPHNTTQHHTTQHNTTQHNNIIYTVLIDRLLHKLEIDGVSCTYHMVHNIRGNSSIPLLKSLASYILYLRDQNPSLCQMC